MFSLKTGVVRDWTSNIGQTGIHMQWSCEREASGVAFDNISCPVITFELRDDPIINLTVSYMPWTVQVIFDGSCGS
jgi:hypothetical protein